MNICLDDVLDRLQKAANEAGSNTAFAREIGVAPEYIQAILAEKRPPGPKVLAALKLRKVVVFEEIEG